MAQILKLGGLPGIGMLEAEQKLEEIYYNYPPLF
jgi:hypothetical protein